MQYLAFQLKRYKMEVFEIIFLLVFYSKTPFHVAYISFQ